jgi:hypothetical protein
VVTANVQDGSVPGGARPVRSLEGGTSPMVEEVVVMDNLDLGGMEEDRRSLFLHLRHRPSRWAVKPFLLPYLEYRVVLAHRQHHRVVGVHELVLQRHRVHQVWRVDLRQMSHRRFIALTQYSTATRSHSASSIDAATSSRR